MIAIDIKLTDNESINQSYTGVSSSCNTSMAATRDINPDPTKIQEMFSTVSIPENLKTKVQAIADSVCGAAIQKLWTPRIIPVIIDTLPNCLFILRIAILLKVNGIHCVMAQLSPIMLPIRIILMLDVEASIPKTPTLKITCDKNHILLCVKQYPRTFSCRRALKAW